MLGDFAINPLRSLRIAISQASQPHMHEDEGAKNEQKSTAF